MKKIPMLMTGIIVLILVWTASSFPQVKQHPNDTSARKQTIRLVHLQYVNPETVAQALTPFTKYDLATVIPNFLLKTITISGSAETVAAIEAMIHELDVAPPAPRALPIFEITVDFIWATSGYVSQKQLPVPARLDQVVKELRTNFQYQNYQLMDSIVLTNTEQQGGFSNGSTGYVNSDVPVEYRLTFEKSSMIGDSNKTVRLHDLKISFKYGYEVTDDPESGKGHTEYAETGFGGTNLDVRPGQQLVFGKSGVMGRAIIAVISVKVIG
jgi:hypothetical protein